MADHSRDHDDQQSYHEGFGTYDNLPLDDPLRAANEGRLLGKKGKQSFSLAELREKPLVLAGIGVGGVVLLGLVVWMLIGLFGGQDDFGAVRKESRVARQLVPPGADKPKPGKTPPAEQPEPEENDQQPPPPTPPKIEEEAPPPRPDDVAQWKKEDYFSARVEGDPRLLDAVAHLAQFVDSASVAEGLADLLKPPPSPPEPNPTTTGRRPPHQRVARISRELTQKIVDALATNQTDAARAALIELLAGTFPAEDARAAADAVLQAMADHPSGRNEAILLEVATEPGKFQQAGQPHHAGVQGPRQALLALIDKHGSAELRAKLAEYLLQPSTSIQDRETLSKILLKKIAENLHAQAILYQSDQIPDPIRATMTNHFTDHSVTLMRHVLGLPAVASERHQAKPPAPVAGWGRPAPAAHSGWGQPAAPTASQPAVASDLPFRIAQQLWSPALVEAFGTRLEGVGSLKDRDAALVKLAAAMPVDALRAGVHRVLERHWQLGPRGLEAAGLSGQALTDPALLLSVKALPRVDPEEAAALLKQSPRRPVPRFGRPAPATPTNPDEQAKLAWTETSEALVEAWCARLHEAAQAARQQGVLKSLPVDVRPDANVTAQYRVSWPGADRAKYNGLPVGPMLVHYVRVEETNRPDIVEGFYRRALRIRDPRPLKDGVWMDSSEQVPDTPRRRSIDVLIHRLKPSADPNSRQPEELVVEILTVEMNDPTR